MTKRICVSSYDNRMRERYRFIDHLVKYDGHNKDCRAYGIFDENGYASHEDLMKRCIYKLSEMGIFILRTDSVYRCLRINEDVNDCKPIEFLYPGLGDITGITLKGKFLSVEVKSVNGVHLSKNQEKFKKIVEAHNALYFVVASYGDIKKLCRKIKYL